MDTVLISDWIDSNQDKSQQMAESIIDDAVADMAAQLTQAAGCDGATEEARRLEKYLCSQVETCKTNLDDLAKLREQQGSSNPYRKIGALAGECGVLGALLKMAQEAYRDLARKYARQVTVCDFYRLWNKLTYQVEQKRGEDDDEANERALARADRDSAELEDAEAYRLEVQRELAKA